jgi:hypothetical protein
VLRSQYFEGSVRGYYGFELVESDCLTVNPMWV